MNIIKKIPLPLSGLMLGTAALGNLLQSYSEGIRTLCGVIAFILLIGLILKIIFYPSMIKEDLKNPVLASISATFPMGIMLLSIYAKPLLGNGAKIIWIFAVLLHVLLILYFTYKFILKLDIKKVFASYFIVYVGIAAAGITAPAYEMQNIGTIAFWFGFISLILLLGIIGYRYLKYPEIPEPLKPLFCIFTAPTSLCIAAYIQSVSNKSASMVIFMLILAFVLYIIALWQLFTYIRYPFYPSFSAFTFPFVISAIATKQSNALLLAQGYGLGFLGILILMETVIAVILVCFTLFHYIKFLTAKSQ